MFHEVERVLSEPAILAEVDGERAITDHSVEWSSEAVNVKEVTASTEAADIALEHKLPVCSNLMPDTSSHERIDPFKVARAGDCSR